MDFPSTMWKAGQKLINESNRALGPGVVLSVEGRFINVFFPERDLHLRMSPDAAGIRPVQFRPGDEVRLPDGVVTTIRSIRGRVVRLATGEMADLSDLWPNVTSQSPVDRLAACDVDDLLDVLNRIDGQRLLNYRRRGEVASLVGGRVELFAHQIDTAARAIRGEEVRWLLADGVGLGKTVVACMITSALIRMGRVEQAVIITPDTLTVQWLGELYRKFHQVFVHIDPERLGHVRTDFGADVNPFDVHRLSIVSAELLEAEPGLLYALQKAPPELLVVDEAHQTFDEAIAEVLLPVVEQVEHALLLTATPFQIGAEGFMKLVDALRLPCETRGDATVVRRVSAVTRNELESFALREPRPIDLADDDTADDLSADDPRVQWLLQQTSDWQAHDDKILLFVSSAARAKKLADTLTRETGRRVFLFHEEMGTKSRDIQLARFRIAPATFLVSSGAGGEGRNFQFCESMVHMDLPPDPVVLEQRIGRLDRIGRDGDIPIYYFRREGPAGLLAAVYERVGIFADAAIGSSPAMSHLRDVLRTGVGDLDALQRDVAARVAREGGDWIFPDSHERKEDDTVLDEIPEDLDDVLQRFCVDAAERIGMDVVAKEGEATYYFEYGTSVEVETIPGLPVGSRFLGTFDRRRAREKFGRDSCCGTRRCGDGHSGRELCYGPVRQQREPGCSGAG